MRKASTIARRMRRCDTTGAHGRGTYRLTVRLLDPAGERHTLLCDRHDFETEAQAEAVADTYRNSHGSKAIDVFILGMGWAR